MQIDLSTMTQQQWGRLTPAERDKVRDLSGLSPQLTGLEGYRVEVVTTDGETLRFIVGRSTGWRPCHIALPRRDSVCEPAADRSYQSVRPLYRVKPNRYTGAAQ